MSTGQLDMEHVRALDDPWANAAYTVGRAYLRALHLAELSLPEPLRSLQEERLCAYEEILAASAHTLSAAHRLGRAWAAFWLDAGKRAAAPRAREAQRASESALSSTVPI